MRKTNESKKGKDYFDRTEKSTQSRASKNHRHQSSTFRASQHFKENKKFNRPSTSKALTVQPCTDPSTIHHQSQMRSQHVNFNDLFPRQNRNADLARLKYTPRSTYADTFVMPPLQFSQFGHSNYSNYVSVNPGCDYERRTKNGFSELEFRRPFHPLNSGTIHIGRGGKFFFMR